MRIYTKTGDDGTTGLYSGERISKSAPRIGAYGDIDELNAILGMVRAESSQEPIRHALKEIQVALFSVGAQLASRKIDPKVEVITSAHVDSLERQIDVIAEMLPPLENFVLPGGSKTAALLHLARTVCRRAERSMVHLSQSPNEEVDHWLLTFINRLSDFLFILARLGNQLENIEDIPWKS